MLPINKIIVQVLLTATKNINEKYLSKGAKFFYFNIKVLLTYDSYWSEWSAQILNTQNNVIAFF